MRTLQIEEVNSVSGGANDGLFVIQDQATWGTQFSGGTAFGSAPGISGFDGFKTWLEGQGGDVGRRLGTRGGRSYCDT